LLSILLDFVGLGQNLDRTSVLGLYWIHKAFLAVSRANTPIPSWLTPELFRLKELAGTGVNDRITYFPSQRKKKILSHEKFYPMIRLLNRHIPIYSAFVSRDC
jgi:hypothetical protein